LFSTQDAPVRRLVVVVFCRLVTSFATVISTLLQTEVSYDYPRDAFLVSAGAAYVPGQQVFISYGAQNNDSLMQVGLPGRYLVVTKMLPDYSLSGSDTCCPNSYGAQNNDSLMQVRAACEKVQIQICELAA
jgi:hypothetical protein